MAPKTKPLAAKPKPRTKPTAIALPRTSVAKALAADAASAGRPVIGTLAAAVNAAERKQNVLEARLAERGLLHAYESTKKALQKIDDAQGYLDPEDEERLLKLATAYAAMDDVLHSMIRECRE